MRFFISVILIISTITHAAEDHECAKAILGHLKAIKFISNESQGICVGDLTSLPRVEIGLGSSVFKEGSADGNLTKDTLNKLAVINDIFTGTKNFSNVQVNGYADGSKNLQPIDENQFLEGALSFPSSLTKPMILEQISSDPKISKTVKDLLQQYNDTDLINKKDIPTVMNLVRADPEKLTKPMILGRISFDPRTSDVVKELLKKYSDTDLINKKDIPEVMSLVRNVYLAKQRAYNHCIQLKGNEKICSDQSTGFASPVSEALGNIECDNRRRVVMTFSGQVSPAIQKYKNGTLTPPFKVPASGQEKRNMQLASGLDLFKKLKEAQLKDHSILDPNSYEKYVETIIPNECSKDQITRQNTRDNFLRSLDHVRQLSDNLPVSSANLRKAIFDGDYKETKKWLEKLLSKEEDKELTSVEREEKRLIQAVLTGYDYGLENDAKRNGKEFLVLKNDGTVKKVPNVLIHCSHTGIKNLRDTRSINDPDFNQAGRPTLLRNENNYERGGHICVSIDNKTYVHDIYDPGQKEVKRVEYESISLKKFSSLDSGTLMYAHPKYPRSSVVGNSIDQLNCLSSADAIEEGLNSGEGTIGGTTIEASDLVKDGDQKLKLTLQKSNLPLHTDQNGKNVHGWGICQYCKSGHGIRESDPMEYKGKMRYSSRDFNTGFWSSGSIEKAKSEQNLNMTTLKSPAVYIVTRDSFSGKCSEKKSVCECLKEVGKEIKLENVLANSNTDKKVMPDRIDERGRFPDTNVDIPSPKDSCIYIPPVSYTCKVDSRGVSQDVRTSPGGSNICRSLDNMINSYPNLFASISKTNTDGGAADIKNKLLKDYSKIPLSDFKCRDIRPSDDETLNCPGVAKAAIKYPDKVKSVNTVSK